MKPAVPKLQRCAIYTRKSTEHNLDLEFNSLDAQREACEAYIKSQAHEGWRLVPDHYDDGGLSGASLDRPALQDLLADVRAGKITVVVVYKVDRLTRSLADFAKLVELFDLIFVPHRTRLRRHLDRLRNGPNRHGVRCR
jgi:site-specific DNA recombinase